MPTVEARGEGVFDLLVGDIVSGKYPAGAHLPAERDLARLLGASRPTLREALRRLAGWNLVAARRGSGIVVRDRREWRFEVLPVYLRVGGAEPAALGQLVIDLLDVRRALILDVLRIVAGRIRPGALAEARAAARRAFEARREIAKFVEEDFGVLRAVVEAAGFLPALWLINGIAQVYLDVARTLTGAAFAPESYLTTLTTVLDALEAGDVDGACRQLGGYLTQHDQRLTTALGLRRPAP